MKSPKEGITMDFFISIGQCRVVEQNRGKIKEIFGVQVTLPPLHSSAGIGGSNTAPVSIEISGEKENAMKAKKYILSMTCENEVQEQYPPEFLDNLDFNEIVSETQTFVFKVGRDKVVFRGDDPLDLAKTRSLIDHKYDEYKKQNENPMSGHGLHTQELIKPREVGDKAPNLIIVPPRHSVKPEERRCLSGEGVINITPPPKNPPSFHDHVGDDQKSRSSSNSLHEELDRRPPELVSRDPYPQKLSQDFVKDPAFREPTIISESGSRQFLNNAAQESRWGHTNKDRSFDEGDSSLAKEFQSSRDDFEPPPEIKRQPSVDRTRAKEYDSHKGTLNDTLKLRVMQKLGYSGTDVEHIMQQLGPNAGENDILEALVIQNKQPMSHQRISRSIPDVKEEPATETRQVRDLSDSTPSKDDVDNLRTIIIDGSNVAMSYGNKTLFACKGIEIVVNWFLTRNHREIFVFVPNWRKEASKPDTPISDQQVLDKLEKLGILVFTPSKRIAGRRITCYDDRYILNAAAEYDGIVVSNDNFRDLQNEKPTFKKVIEERVLMFSFVGRHFMPPDDPLGRDGPSLDNFLRKRPIAPDHPPQQCPYGKKCTYGNKCKYFHPERPSNQKPISEQLKERDETRRREQLLNGLLDYKRGDNSADGNLNMHHNGLHTEPLPRQTSIDHTDPRQSHEGAVYKGSPHRVRTHHETHPPPYIHTDPNGGHYTTEPLPPRIPAESGYGTVPLRHMPQHMEPGQSRHHSLPMGQGASGGPYSDLNAEMAKLALGGNPAIHDARPQYNPAANVRYNDPPGPPHRPASHTAPLPRPDHGRPYVPPQHAPQDVYGYYAGNTHPLPPSGHSVHNQGVHHQQMMRHHQQPYPNHPGGPAISSLPPNLSGRGLYPSLPPTDGAIHSYPNPQHRGYETMQGRPAPHSGGAMDAQHNFIICFKDVYGEKAIREVLDKYPNETDHKRLHMMMQHHLNIR